MTIPRKNTPEEFVRVWQESTSAADAAKKLGMTATSANAKATRFRKRGVPLKFHDGRRGPKSINYEALATLAKSLHGDQ